MVSKYACITNPHFVKYIPISTVSFPKNIKLVWHSLYYFTFLIVSDFSRFHSEVCHIKAILKKIKKYFKISQKQPVTLTAEKKDLVIVLPFLGKLSLGLRTRLKNSISKNLPFSKIRVIFKSLTSISNFFQFKDKMVYCLRSNVVYKFSCGRCNATYYGETCRHLRIELANTRVFHLQLGKSQSPKSLKQ